MDIRKDDTERAINLLKLYKSKLNKPEEKSLRKAMEKLTEALESQLFDALMDIQEFYEVTLSNAITGDQQQVEPVKEVVVEQQTPIKPKKEKSKKTKRHQKSQDDEDQVDGSRVQSPPEKGYEEDYQYNEPQYEVQENVQPEQEELEDDQNPWQFFEIQLNKGKKGYGFAVAGGYDKNHYDNDNGIFVTKIIPGGAAEVDGQLRIDDVIVSVNETSLEYVTHDTAVDTLKNAGANMTLVIRRLKDEFYANDQTNLDQEYQEPSKDSIGLYSPPVEHEQEPTSQDDQFHQFEIVLTKRQGAGLGFSIQGGYDVENPEVDAYISVSKLTPGGVAEVDGRLQVNDILLMVDDRSLNGLSHDECVTMLKNTGKSVKLFVGRFVDVQPEEPVVEKTEKKKKKKHKRDRNED